MKLANRLGAEKSPYLRQHKDNPVAWFAWGPEAFAAARELNRPIFLSIGYSTCYWCHMMEKDSFERQEVADVLNESYISIKVDREEHPEVDEIYMDAVIGMTGRGGWPMSVLLTPELKPFWGGTYFPRTQFIQVLSRIAQLWKETPEQIISNSAKLTEYLTDTRTLNLSAVVNTELASAKAREQFVQRFDAKNGGFGEAPKFPSTMGLRFLTRLAARDQNADTRHMVLGSLDAMASGGIYDHLGGGFHRYSVDERWLVPHFEKMLYDNALLATTYLEAQQAFGIPYYGEVARETLDYVLREMTSPEGGFYAAQDAGDAGKEGEFYVWAWEELAEALSPEEFKNFGAVFPLAQQGNFEHGKNILHLDHIESWGKRRAIKMLRDKLFELRAKRAAPLRDDKILTAWNGLMLGALARGARVLAEPRYLAAAEKCARLLREKLYASTGLLRRYCEGEAKYNATSADYSYLIQGLLELHQSSLKVEWLEWAISLQAEQDEKFWDAKNSGYFTAANNEQDLIVRKKDFPDGALPSPNSVSAENMLRLFHYTFNESYRERVTLMTKFLAAELERVPMGYAQFLLALDFAAAPVKEIIISGKPEDASVKQAFAALGKAYLPYTVWGALSPGEPVSKLPLWEAKASDEQFRAYICEIGSCQKPIQSLAEFLQYVNPAEADD